MWIIPSNIYHYVQDTEALISDSQEFYQMCEQSLMWRSKPSQSTTWSRRLKRAGWMQHLFGRTLKPSHGEAFTRKWTSSLEDSLVSLSQQQEEEEETKTLDICGPTSSEESENWEDLPLFSWRMLKGSSAVSSSLTNGQTLKEPLFCSMSLENWKGWVTKQRQEYSVRKKSVRPIEENGFLLWACADQVQNKPLYQIQPTPQVEEQTNTPNWATPNTMDYLPQRGEEALRRQATTSRKGRKSPANLREQVNTRACQIYEEENQIQPTPQVEEQTNTHGSLQESQNWATPSVRDEKDAGLLKERSPRKDGKPRIDSVPIQVLKQENYKGKLNPRWVETLMGVPVGWTLPSCTELVIIERMNSECSETESFQIVHPKPSSHSSLFWSTPPASQRGDTLEVYLRRSINRIKNGGQPFAPILEVTVFIADLGLSSSPSDLFRDIDLFRDTEDIIQDILNAHS